MFRYMGDAWESSGSFRVEGMSRGGSVTWSDTATTYAEAVTMATLGLDAGYEKVCIRRVTSEEVFRGVEPPTM